MSWLLVVISGLLVLQTDEKWQTIAGLVVIAIGAAVFVLQRGLL